MTATGGGTMTFGDPKWLNLLWGTPAVVFIFFYGARCRRRDLKAFAGPVLSDALAPGRSWRRALLKGVLSALAFVLIVLGIARPQFGRQLVKVERDGIDLVIALDTSLSMLAEDMKPNRLDRAKQEIVDLIRGLKGDRVGIVAFAGDAAVLCPLTVDYDAALMFAQTADVDVVSTPGTALGEAIDKSAALFEETDRPKSDRVIILVTDGESHSGEPVQAARRAASRNIRVYTIGIGNPSGELIPLRGTDGAVTGYKKDESGETVLTRLDETTLREISAASGGKYLPATRQGIELKVLYQEISGMAKASVEGEFIERKQDRFAWFLIAAVALLALESLVARRGRIQREERERSLHTGIVRGIAFLACLGTASVATAKDLDRGKVKAGNEYYGAGEHEKALALYGEALRDSTARSLLIEGLRYNEGNALHMLGRYEEALGKYGQSFEDDSLRVGQVLYNRGNTLMAMGKPGEAVESYVQALQFVTDDEDARFNLELALRALQEQQQQQQQNQQQQQQQRDQQQDDSERNQDRQQGEQEGNDEDSPDQQRDQQPDSSRTREPSLADSTRAGADSTQVSPQPVQLTREDALRILRLLEEQEEELQKAKRKAAFKRISRTGKDW